MLVTLIFILFLLCCDCVLGCVFFCSSLSLARMGPCDRDAVPERRCAPTRSDGTERAKRRVPETVQTSGDRGGAVRRQSIRRTRRREGRANAWRRLAATCGDCVQSRQ